MKTRCLNVERERDAVKVILSWKLGGKYRTNRFLNP